MTTQTLYQRLVQGRSGSLDITELVSRKVPLSAETRTLILTGRINRDQAAQLVFQRSDIK